MKRKTFFGHLCISVFENMFSIEQILPSAIVIGIALVVTLLILSMYREERRIRARYSLSAKQKISYYYARFSENIYLAGLCMGFTVFAILVWFILIPNGFVEYNLGVNLFTESIFLILTIVFLTYIIGFGEKRRLRQFGLHVLDSLFYELKTIAKLLSGCLQTHEEKTRVGNLKRAIRGRQYIYEIEDKYADFLEPDLRLPLFDIQEKLADLEYYLSAGNFPSKKAEFEKLSDGIKDTLKEINRVLEKMKAYILRFLISDEWQVERVVDQYARLLEAEKKKKNTHKKEK